MAYKEGSMGLAILIGMLVFLALNAIFGLFTPMCMNNPMGGGQMCMTLMDMMAMAGAGAGDVLSAMLAGSALIGFLPIFAGGALGMAFALSIIAILLAIIPPLIAGVLAAFIARGSAGRGFMSGFSSVIMGYYIGFVILIIYAVATAGPMLNVITANMGMFIMPILGAVLIIPIIIGVFGGIGGAIISALMAQPSKGGQAAAAPVTTNIIQAAAPAAAPVIIQGGPTTKESTTTTTTSPKEGGAAAAKTKTNVICPACKAENERGTTFCQSCGTRLKS